MKIMNKSNLNIKKLNDGTYSIGYIYNGNFDVRGMEQVLMVNVLTKEQESFGSLILFADKDNVFLYPQRMRNTRKKEAAYELRNWLFIDDAKLKQTMDNEVASGTINTQFDIKSININGVEYVDKNAVISILNTLVSASRDLTNVNNALTGIVSAFSNDNTAPTNTSGVIYAGTNTNAEPVYGSYTYEFRN